MEISRLLFWDYFLFKKKLNLSLVRLIDLFKYSFIKVKVNNIPLMLWKLDEINEDVSYIEKIFFINEPNDIIKISGVQNSVNTLKYTYESIDEDIQYLKQYGFVYKDSNILMKLNLKDKKYNNINPDVSFMTFIKGEHDQLRCDIQNEAFFDENRIPLNIRDIVYEYNKSFFIEDLTQFIKVKSKVVGYGQILFLEDKYIISNIGVLKNYQGKGYGRELLIKLLELAKSRNISEIYIKVKHSNYKAFSLYKSLGFEEYSRTNVYEIS